MLRVSKKITIFAPMFQIDAIINIIWKGFLIGVIVSAPMGPVGVLCIQRTLNKGRWYGFVTGIGACISDLLYALLTGFGMSFVFDYVNKNVFYLQLIGSIMLMCFAIYTFRSNPMNSLRPVKQGIAKGSLFHNAMTAFLVTISNPLIIFLFIGLFARFDFVTGNVLLLLIGFASIAGGALAWWYSLTFFINKLRRQFNINGIVWLNRGIGIIVFIAAVVALVFTVTGKSLY